jgi:hypothetical protein
MANIERIQPIAQTFAITNGAGAYLTKVGLFFYSKAEADDYSVQLHIRPAFTGVPDINIILENSIVYKGSSEITTSTDASAETTFTFDEPVYVEGNREYAIVITSNAKADSYQVFTSLLGGFVAGSTTKRIQSDPYSGIFFRSSNGSLFEPDLLRDLTFNLYRAKFTYQNTIARLKASPPPLKLLETDPFKFSTGDATLRVYHSNHGFQVNDVVTLSADSDGITTSSTINGVLGSSILGERTITAIDASGYRFEMDSTADSAVFGGGSGILATEQYILDTFRTNLEIQQPLNTSVTYSATLTSTKSYAGSETAYGEEIINIISNEDVNLVNPQVIATALRDANLGKSTFYIDAYLNSVDNFVSPVIDIQRTNVISVHNIIDNQDSSATDGYNVPLDYIADSDAIFGSAIAKHLTKPVVLTEPATGIKVLVDVNRPAATNFEVYYRTLETGADTPITDQSWIEASKIEPSSNHNNVPTDTDYNLFREYRYTIGGDYVGALTPFNSYQIKIVMHSTSSSNIPRFKALRTIALGT